MENAVQMFNQLAQEALARHSAYSDLAQQAAMDIDRQHLMHATYG